MPPPCRARRTFRAPADVAMWMCHGCNRHGASTSQLGRRLFFWGGRKENASPLTGGRLARAEQMGSTDAPSRGDGDNHTKDAETLPPCTSTDGRRRRAKPLVATSAASRTYRGTPRLLSPRASNRHHRSFNAAARRLLASTSSPSGPTMPGANSSPPNEGKEIDTPRQKPMQTKVDEAGMFQRGNSTNGHQILGNWKAGQTSRLRGRL